MKKLLLLMAIAAMPVLLAADTVDQSQNSFASYLSGFMNGNLIQTFQPSASWISGASAYVYGPDLTGDITIAVWNNFPEYGGTKLAGGTVNNVTGSQWVTVYWPAVAITPRTTYYLVVTGTNPSMWWSGDTNDPYKLGQLYQGGAGGGYASDDYAFKTFAPSGAPVPEPASMTLLASGLFAAVAMRPKKLPV